MTPSIDATYGVWLVSLVLETMSLFFPFQFHSSLTLAVNRLYGAGMLQVWMYFSASPTDPASIKWTVSIVAVLETIQVIFFSVSSYSRFVKLFGVPQTNLIWADSLQLLCAFLSAFVVQLFFANRIIKLTKGRGKFSLKAFGIYVILALAFIEILAGIAQVAWTYQIRSFLKLDQTKITATIQSGASFACDVLITSYLCLFLKNQKGEMMKTNHMVDALIYDAINRGTLTAMSSFVTLVLFLVLPNTFWFFLGLAPSSKLYMNSMLATLNTRQRIRNKIDAGDKGWDSIGNSIPLSTLQIGNKNTSGQSQSIPSIAAVDLETGSSPSLSVSSRSRESNPSSKQWRSTEPGWSQTHDGRSRMDENPPLARDGEREWDADLDCRVNWERSRTVQKSGGIVDHYMDENAPLALDGEREWDADLDCRVNWERSRTVQKSGGIVDHYMDENAPLALDGEREWDADLDCRGREPSIITSMKIYHSRGTASAGGMQLSTALYSFGQRKRAGIEYHMDEVHHLRWTVSAGGWMYGLLLPALDWSGPRGRSMSVDGQDTRLPHGWNGQLGGTVSGSWLPALV
ncbi:hypothetical protein C8R43DRAFT_1118955 [Mycena crocata]|nr:hypothetical protein C8R43DRAFT_1118955 [Mycena crocata]